MSPTWTLSQGKHDIYHRRDQGLTFEIVHEHRSADDCWVVIHGRVYDVS